MLPRYDLDHGGIAKLLVADDMGEAMRAHARAAVPVAVGLSPVDTSRFAEPDVYSQSFEVDVETDLSTASPRKVAILANNAEHAAAVEFGRTYVNADGSTTSYDGHHVLGRVADMLGKT